MALSQALAANLRRIRIERGLSQEELAAEVGIALTYLGQIERGLRNPTLQVVDRLAATLRIDAILLLTEE